MELGHRNTYHLSFWKFCQRYPETLKGIKEVSQNLLLVKIFQVQNDTSCQKSETKNSHPYYCKYLHKLACTQKAAVRLCDSILITHVSGWVLPEDPGMT